MQPYHLEKGSKNQFLKYIYAFLVKRVILWKSGLKYVFLEVLSFKKIIAYFKTYFLNQVN